MEKINRLVKGAVLLLAVVSGACTKYNYDDGGLANGNHNCTMWEYFQSQPGDWDSTMLMIGRAGLKEWFDGSRPEKITFLGVTNLTIMSFILDHDSKVAEETEKWRGINGIPADSCAGILQRLIIPERLMLDDFPRGRMEKKGGTGGMPVTYQLNGGKVYTTLEGKVTCWTYREDYEIIPEGGAVVLYIAREGTNYEGDRVASCNIQTTTGVVHALDYDFNFRNL